VLPLADRGRVVPAVHGLAVDAYRHAWDLALGGDDELDARRLGLDLAGALARDVGSLAVAVFVGELGGALVAFVGEAEFAAAFVATAELIARADRRAFGFASLEGGACAVVVALGEELHAFLEVRAQVVVGERRAHDGKEQRTGDDASSAIHQLGLLKRSSPGRARGRRLTTGGGIGLAEADGGATAVGLGRGGAGSVMTSPITGAGSVCAALGVGR
jgi:hypothetical protein